MKTYFGTKATIIWLCVGLIGATLIVKSCGWMAFIGIFMFMAMNNFEQLRNHFKRNGMI